MICIIKGREKDYCTCEIMVELCDQRGYGWLPHRILSKIHAYIAMCSKGGNPPI